MSYQRTGPHWNWSKLAIVLAILVIFIVNLSQKLWTRPDRIIQDDVIAYYQYLPAIFIIKDLSLTNFVNVKDTGDVKIWVKDAGNGKGIGKMTMGMAVLYAPFFLCAHLLAEPLGFEANGFTAPYKLLLVISSMVYLTLGLFYLRKLLLKYFSDNTVALALLILVTGTNLFFYAFANPAMSHVYSFCLLSLFTLQVVKWLDKPSYPGALSIGLIAGLIILVRPMNGIIVVILLLWGVGNRQEWRDRISHLINLREQLLLMLLSGFVVLLLQFIYWKYITGDYLFFAYGRERFFLDNPQFIRGLFSYKKGWLLYAPVMIFALAGLMPLFKKNRGLFIPVFLFTVLHMYIIFSWWSWYAGGSFGMRFMIEAYALLAVPLAAFLAWLFERRWSVRIPVSLLILFFIFLNIFQTVQYRKGSISPSGMTKQAYWANFLKMEPTGKFYNSVREYDEEKALQGIYEELPSLLMDKEAFMVNTRKYILSDSAWMEQIRHKAASRNIPVDSMISKDILWLWERNQQKLHPEGN